MKITKLFKDFFESEKAGGFILIACTLLSLFLANSIWSENYLHIWHYHLGNYPIEHWINDGLMTIFFLLIGLELEREIYNGELSDFKNALLPISGALGGMLLPASLFLFLNDSSFFNIKNELRVLFKCSVFLIEVIVDKCWLNTSDIISKTNYKL